MKCFMCILFISLAMGCIMAHQNNVCKTFPDYYLNLYHNKNCYYNPDADLRVPEIITRHGYPLETHHVTTVDGYILTVFRIPYGKNSTVQKPGPPVFLQHGITLNCVAFVDTGRKSLGFILADAGYDVWLGNFRGSLYSRNHTTLSTSSKKYWDFSFTENGIYDLPAQLDLVSDISEEKITYIGFSMGTTAAYIYGVTYPDVAYEKIKIFISLAPIAFLNDIKTVVRFLIPLWRFVEPLEAEFHGQLMLRSRAVTKALCLPYPFQMKLCATVSMIVFGFDYAQEDPETLPITLLQNLDVMSVKTLTHYIQLVQSGKFQYFDYGLVGNFKTYGSLTPPQYELAKMKVPNYLIRGKNDLLATKGNVEKLSAALPERTNPYPIYVIQYDKFMHSDFLSAKDVVPFCYDHVVDFISNR